jgi:SAM-dependent methyltransferase
MTRLCNVCRSAAISPVFRSGERFSLTTMNTLIEGETIVSYCPDCDHVQSDELPNLAAFYAEEYEINLPGADDDQLYAVVDGREVYRSDHQAQVLADKIDLTKFRNVLDYGCAKAPSLRKLIPLAPSVRPYLFDVTDKYVSYWKDFPGRADWACHRPKPEWKGQMDVVLSFYALEHIPHLSKVLDEIADLLRDGGYFYFLVPNLYENAADFIVADHVNHFSRNSLRVMLQRAGFDRIEIDETAHTAAFVVKARLNKSAVSMSEAVAAEMKEQVRELATFWSGIKQRIEAFEAQLSPEAPRGIYGAGIYGNFIFSCLREPERLTCFLDQNKFLVGTEIKGVPVRHPSDIPAELQTLMIGLNPKSAHRIIAQVEAFEGRNISYFFLDARDAA